MYDTDLRTEHEAKPPKRRRIQQKDRSAKYSREEEPTGTKEKRQSMEEKGKEPEAPDDVEEEESDGHIIIGKERPLLKRKWDALVEKDSMEGRAEHFNWNFPNFEALDHVPMLIRALGALKLYSTLVCEAFHKFIRDALEDTNKQNPERDALKKASCPEPFLFHLFTMLGVGATTAPVHQSL